MEMERFEADELLALARVDFDAKRLDQALYKLKACLSRPACPAEAVILTARVYATLKLFDRAAELFEVYVSNNPSAITERFEWGMVLFESGHISRATAIWDEVLTQNPRHPPALYFMALAKLENGDAEAAQEKLDLLLRTAAPDNLYFTKAKELIDAGVIAKASSKSTTLQ